MGAGGQVEFGPGDEGLQYLFAAGRGQAEERGRERFGQGTHPHQAQTHSLDQGAGEGVDAQGAVGVAQVAAEGVFGDADAAGAVRMGEVGVVDDRLQRLPLTVCQGLRFHGGSGLRGDRKGRKKKKDQDAPLRLVFR